MARAEQAVDQGSTSVRVDVEGSGEANVSTGVPVLDHLLALLARHASFDLTLEVAPRSADEEISAAGRALGQALADALRAEGCRSHGSAAVPADEALAHVAIDASGRPLVVANVDLSDQRVGGLSSDVLSRFLDEFAQGAGLTLHVRLIEGKETQHVLDSIFKALGVALSQACAVRKRQAT